MSPSGKETGQKRLGFPRVSGDEPGCELTGTDGNEFSPRERG